MQRSTRIVAALGLVIFLVTADADSAVTPNSPVYPQQIRSPAAQILPGSGTTAQQIVTPGTNVGQNGTKVIGITCSNTDTVAGYAIQLIKTRSSTSYIINTVWVPPSAGFSASASAYVPPVSLMPPSTFGDTAGNSYVVVEGSSEAAPANSDTLNIASTTTVSTGKIISCVATASDL
jgi:hypothetical protein